MRKLIVFNHITLDGYFVGEKGDFSWARTGNDDPEYSAFVADNARGEGQLLFGRITYELMAGYWPTARTMFEGIREMLTLKLTKTRTFNNGKIFLCFEPAA